MSDYKLQIRMAISHAFKNIDLNELIDLLEGIVDDLKSLESSKKVLENYMKEKHESDN